ncbi:hypothetical protein dsx2_2416 [Desulfovibrio sp. X2]|uniref:hypothetical protein n=1 Tax=Desulfovibrio sp. X2 TaxID=941449 RepID=UPI000358EC7D|nr:hypothetical protein [Desulfovibrio sp. X2]EPR43372.1 hypothetical protein dsx2_2416 [Desulfovibrio sp. X2]
MGDLSGNLTAPVKSGVELAPGMRAMLLNLIREELTRVTGRAQPAAVETVRLMTEKRLESRMMLADAGDNALTPRNMALACREAMLHWLVSAHYPLQHTADLLDAVLVAAGQEPSIPHTCPDLLSPWQKVVLGLLFIQGMRLDRAASFLGMSADPLREALSEAVTRVQGLGLRVGSRHRSAQA